MSEYHELLSDKERIKILEATVEHLIYNQNLHAEQKWLEALRIYRRQQRAVEDADN